MDTKLQKKLQKEKSKLDEAGSFEEYVKQRRVKIDLVWFAVTVLGAFVLGAIIF